MITWVDVVVSGISALIGFILSLALNIGAKIAFSIEERKFFLQNFQMRRNANSIPIGIYQCIYYSPTVNAIGDIDSLEEGTVIGEIIYIQKTLSGKFLGYLLYRVKNGEVVNIDKPLERLMGAVYTEDNFYMGVWKDPIKARAGHYEMGAFQFLYGDGDEKNGVWTGRNKEHSTTYAGRWNWKRITNISYDKKQLKKHLKNVTEFHSFRETIGLRYKDVLITRTKTKTSKPEISKETKK